MSERSFKWGDDVLKWIDLYGVSSAGRACDGYGFDLAVSTFAGCIRWSVNFMRSKGRDDWATAPNEIQRLEIGGYEPTVEQAKATAEAEFIRLHPEWLIIIGGAK